MTSTRLGIPFALAFVVAHAAACGDGGGDRSRAETPSANADRDGGGASRDAGGASSPPCPALPAIPAGGDADRHALYPEPRFADVGRLEARADTVCFDTTALASHARLDALLPEIAESAGLRLASFDCNCGYRIAFDAHAPALTGAAADAWAAAADHAERYVVASATADGRAGATLFATTERGALYAARAAVSLAQRPSGADGPRVARATIVDFPTFARRGVVEGIYNPAACSMLALPWRVGERRAAIQLLYELRGNAYLYSPKCDPYARDEWQTPYPPGSSDENVIRVALHEAERHLLDFVWAVSPGVEGLAAVDPAKLKAKIDAMRAIGVRHFGLFLDDIDDHSAAPQIALINAIDDYVREAAPSERLLVVGTTYCGHSGNAYNCEGPNAYTDRLGAEVHPTVDFMWTGEDVIPSTMRASDMTAIDASYRRKVTIWDNWPDVATGFTGRAGDLGTAVEGYFSNPLLSERGQPIDAYFRVMGPIFDYLWAPERYAAKPSYDAWQPRVASHGVCTPCGGLPSGWTCDAQHPKTMLFCDPQTKCLAAHACPKGCVVGAPGVEDVCN